MLQKPRQQVWQAAKRVKLRIIDIFIDGKPLFSRKQILCCYFTNNKPLFGKKKIFYCSPLAGKVRVMFLFNADSELNIGQFENQIELLCENAVLTRGLQELPW